MLEAAGNSIVAAMDCLLGWVLYLPRDLMLFTVAVLTSAILSFVRLFSTDQDWLKRAAADRKRLGELIKQARRRGDKQARKRHKATLTLIKVKSLRFEAKPLLYAVDSEELVRELFCGNQRCARFLATVRHEE